MGDPRRVLDAKHSQAVSKVRGWLRSLKGDVTAILPQDLAQYEREFARGWNITVNLATGSFVLGILLPKTFPYAHPRIALLEPKKYLEWPHIEEDGILCLERIEATPDDPIEFLKQTLSSACELIDQNANQQFRTSEFQREFVSYWNRTCDRNSKPVRSILPSDTITKQVYVWTSKQFDVVAESAEDIQHWLNHWAGFNKRHQLSAKTGVHIRLDLAPIFNEIPIDFEGFFEWMSTSAPSAIPFFVDCLGKLQELTVIVSAMTSSGVGKIAVTYSVNERQLIRGYRSQSNVPRDVLKRRWARLSRQQRRKVTRFDGSWIHGRDRDSSYTALSQSTVLMLGCGSLGSSVAMRLAEAGVGSFVLVDPEVLESANVGRHVLGVESVGTHKVTSLGTRIKRRFPHVRMIYSYPKTWQNLSNDEMNLASNADVIVSTIGDWAAEGPLCDWYVNSPQTSPFVIGWLEEHAVAAHAAAFFPDEGNPLDLFDAAGRTAQPDSQWPKGTEAELAVEPACGALYMPYGPIELGQGAAICTDLILDVLLDHVQIPTEVIYAAATDRILSLNGKWTPYHQTFRPAGFDGPFTRRRPIQSGDFTEQ